MLVITSGFGSEYVLNGLCKWLRAKEIDVIEFKSRSDFENIEDKINSIISKYRNIFYITSAHPSLTYRNSELLYPTFINSLESYWSPIEFLCRLRPIKSMYVPHDLIFPYGDQNIYDINYLNLFDYILSPYYDRSLKALFADTKTNIIDFGWIKSANLNKTDILKISNVTKSKILFLPSFIDHHFTKRGALGFVEYFKNVLDLDVNVKLPIHAASEEINVLLSNKSANIIDPDASALDLIYESDLVITNGSTSIVSEACLAGKQCICIHDDSSSSLYELEMKLYAFPSVNIQNLDRLELINLKSTEPVSDENSVTFEPILSLIHENNK